MPHRLLIIKKVRALRAYIDSRRSFQRTPAPIVYLIELAKLFPPEDTRLCSRQGIARAAGKSVPQHR